MGTLSPSEVRLDPGCPDSKAGALSRALSVCVFSPLGASEPHSQNQEVGLDFRWESWFIFLFTEARGGGKKLSGSWGAWGYLAGQAASGPQPLSGAALFPLLQTQPLTPHPSPLPVPPTSSSGWFCLHRSLADRRTKGTTWLPDQAAAPGRFGGLQKSYNSRGQQRTLRTQTAPLYPPSPPQPPPPASTHDLGGSLPGSQRLGCEQGGAAIAKQRRWEALQLGVRGAWIRILYALNLTCRSAI